MLGNDREISNYTTVVAKQWVTSSQVGTPTDKNGTIEHQQMNGVFCAIRADIVSRSSQGSVLDSRWGSVVSC
jgi:hypothetical protein